MEAVQPPPPPAQNLLWATVPIPGQPRKRKGNLRRKNDNFTSRKLRIKNNMIHTLEKSCDSGKKNDYLLIKSFSRSAAGNTRSCDPKEIRPPYICRRTTNYLIENVLFRNGGFYSADFKMDLTTYHFVFDRSQTVFGLNLRF